MAHLSFSENLDLDPRELDLAALLVYPVDDRLSSLALLS